MSEPSPSRWSEMRDFCAAVRELMIVAAVVSLLVAPSLVRGTLERAGIRSVAGVEFDAKTLAEAQSELDNAKKQIDQMRNQLASAQQQLNQPTTARLAPGTADPKNGDVSRILAQMQSSIDDTEVSLDRSRRLHNKAFGTTELRPIEELMSDRGGGKNR
jgi:peptidoglycan hydrolase CwlO-like protein